ncbi:MAG TPA: Ku protein [Longimicrobium sp.]|nr:Ku protein [Longimicrobium sp.]
MARAIWKGSISFGLVNIPVGLFSAESPDELSFHQLDKRNMSRIGYRKYNKATGEEVESDQIVKGYEYDSEHYVVLSDEDMRRANPEKTQTVEITDFVDLEEIQPTFYDKPYYMAPVGKNKKGYALLREALRRTGKVGIAKVVIRTREQLAAVVPHGDVLLLEILRYPHEIRPTAELDVPEGNAGLNERELEMAEKLVEGMSGEWEPEKYHDTYRDDLMGLIKARIESGNTDQPDETPVEEVAAGDRGDVIDIMALLKRSVEATSRGGAAADRDEDEKPAAAKKAEKKPAAAKADKAEKKKPAAAAKKTSDAKPRSTAAAKPRAKTRKSA